MDFRNSHPDLRAARSLLRLRVDQPTVLREVALHADFRNTGTNLRAVRLIRRLRSGGPTVFLAEAFIRVIIESVKKLEMGGKEEGMHLQV